MKITDVKLRFAKHYLFVQVYTDAGITGLGEAGNWGYLQATAAAIEKFADYLIGKDPFRIEDFNQNFLRSVYFRGSVIMSAAPSSSYCSLPFSMSLKNISNPTDRF